MSSSIENLVNREYQHGFVTDVESDTVPPGLNEDVVTLISRKKGEPEWLLDWRLKAFRRWLTMPEPHWPNVKYPKIDYQASSYYSAPKSVKPLQSLADVDPELLRTYAKLGIILKAGYEVTGFDVVPQKMAALVPFGLKSARSPREAATGADLVVLSLRSWADVTSVVEGKGGILEATHEGQIIADCSTVPPAESRAMAVRLVKTANASMSDGTAEFEEAEKWITSSGVALSTQPEVSSRS